MPDSLPLSAISTDSLNSSIEFGGYTCALPHGCEQEIPQDRLFYLFISIKNREFTRDYIQWFVNACDAGGYRGLVCAVDEPYLYNRMAELATDTLPEHESARIYQVSREVSRKAEKVIRGSMSKNVTLTTWAELTDSTPGWMLEEVTAAYQQKGDFWSSVRACVAVVKSHQDDISLDRYAKFFLCELPVLIYWYYHPTGGAFDVYPGENLEIFTMIEQGVFMQELPRMTDFSIRAKPLVYLNTGSLR